MFIKSSSSKIFRTMYGEYLRFGCIQCNIANMSEFANKQLELLELEHLAEIEENNFERANLSMKVLQRRGLCLPKLIINSLETGLYNRTLASFSLRTRVKAFPFNTLSQGDIVKLVYQQKLTGDDDCNGIVTRVSDTQISVAFDGTGSRTTLDDLNQHGNSVSLLKVANKVTYERLKKAMKTLSTYRNGPAHHLIKVMFGNATPTTSTDFDKKFYDQNLNQCQREAVMFALSQQDVAIIHGPPGTGKTTTIVEIIAQLVGYGQKVLACAPSNVAVDNLVEKLTKASLPRNGINSSSDRKIEVVRLGHPARMLNSKLQKLSLDALIACCGTAAILKDVRSDLEHVCSNLRRCTDKVQQHFLRQQKKSLLAELKKREKKAMKDVLFPVDVVLATNVGAYPDGPIGCLAEDHFDVIVIDECGQALEAACWIPLLRARKCILAGDHLQLSPTIISDEASTQGLSVTLLERLVKLHGNTVVCLLTEQYRMHHIIMDWVSQQMYDGKLTANSSVENHLLCDISGVDCNDDTKVPLLLIDTADCGMSEVESEESDSKGNEGEVKIVYHHVMSLIEAGVESRDIAVISPYNLQVDMLRHLFHKNFPKLEIKSVDGFQGREKEAVILTLVRSNKYGEVGFLSDNKRLNVAVTRARRHLAVVCDSKTVTKHDFMRSLVKYINDHGEVRTGFEYEHLENLEEFDCLGKFTLEHCIGNFMIDSEKTVKLAKQTKICTTKSFASEQKKVENLLSTSLPPPYSNDELVEEYRKIILEYQNHFTLERPITGNSENVAGALNIKVSEPMKEIVFPTTLTAAERKIIHEICDELELNHISIGEKDSRQLIVNFSKKVAGNVTSMKYGDDSKVLITYETEDIIDPISDIVTKCEKCEREILKDDIHLHMLNCERLVMMKAKLSRKAKVSVEKCDLSQKGNKVKKPTLPKKHKPLEEEFDTLMVEAASYNRSCHHGNCTTCVATVNQMCLSCRKLFCLKHCIPEVHGCGSKAQIDARSQMRRGEGGSSNHRLLPKRRAQIKKQLSDKIKDMQKSRKPFERKK